METNKVLSFNQRQDEVQRQLMEDMEMSCQSLRIKQARLNKMGDMVMTNLEKAIKEEKLPAYKAAMAYARMVDSHTKMESTRIQLWDRVNGTVGMFGPIEEKSDENSDIEFAHEREAERLAFQLVKQRVERKKAEAKALEAQKEVSNA